MRYALAIEYQGTRYCGWQRQHHSPSVQQELERALSIVADLPITVVCAGRTDTGVHARAQIAHFDTEVERQQRAWTFGVNSHLPDDIAVHWAGVVSDDFHARYSALGRRYRYTILNRRCRAGLMHANACWESQPLDDAAMQQGADHLVGSHDYNAFRSAECQAPHARRTIHHIRVNRHGDYIVLDVEGNAFLHNMVRIIAGSLIKVGRGERSPDWIAEVLASGDRRQAGKTAPAGGLCFGQAFYPDEFGIPAFPIYWPTGT